MVVSLQVRCTSAVAQGFGYSRGDYLGLEATYPQLAHELKKHLLTASGASNKSFARRFSEWVNATSEDFDLGQVLKEIEFG